MSENTPYYQISLDQYVLSIIVNTLVYSKNALALYDYDTAITQLDFAWDILPRSVRENFPHPPSSVLDDRLLHQIPSENKMLEDRNFRKWSARQRERHRDEIEETIKRNFINEYYVKITSALDAAGLYIKGDIRIKPTADKKASLAPPLTKLPENLPR